MATRQTARCVVYRLTGQKEKEIRKGKLAELLGQNFEDSLPVDRLPLPLVSPSRLTALKLTTHP